MTWPQGQAVEKVAGWRPAGEPAPSGLPSDEALAVLVHELRSPLGVMRNALKVLRLAGTSGPAFERTVGVMERQVGHMGRLVGDLLDLMRATTGKLELRPEWLDLDAAVALAVEACRPLTGASRHMLTTSLPPGPIRLRADPARLHQVLVNLLTNAAKYSDPGGHIRLTAEAGDGLLVLRVQDDGVGIAPDLLPRVFDPFEQGPAQRGRERGGLGIGLALVRWLVEMHGGSVSAHSDGPGTGSEFVVRWPVPEGRALRKAPLALAAPRGRGAGEQRGLEDAQSDRFLRGREPVSEDEAKVVRRGGAFRGCATELE